MLEILDERLCIIYDLCWWLYEVIIRIFVYTLYLHMPINIMSYKEAP